MSWKSSGTKIPQQKTSYQKTLVEPLSARAWFKGKAYIKIILKNHARSYFVGGLIIGETR